MTETYGFFDGNVERDVVPDARLNKKMLGVVVFTVMRPVVGPLVLWNDWELKGGASEWDVTQWSWWVIGFPFRLFLCSVVMDFGSSAFSLCHSPVCLLLLVEELISIY